MSVRVCTVEWTVECPNTDCRNLMRSRVEMSVPMEQQYCPRCGFALLMGDLYGFVYEYDMSIVGKG